MKKYIGRQHARPRRPGPYLPSAAAARATPARPLPLLPPPPPPPPRSISSCDAALPKPRLFGSSTESFRPAFLIRQPLSLLISVSIVPKISRN